MTKVIWKYPVPMDVSFRLKMPENAQVMTVQLQPGHQLDNQPVLWALVDPDADKVSREFRIHGTGHPIEEPVDLFGYIGTWQSGGYVWHLFEVLPEVTVEGGGDDMLTERQLAAILAEGADADDE